MKKILLIITLLFFTAFVSFFSLAYFSDLNTISMTVFAIIALSGFGLSFANYSLAGITKKSTVAVDVIVLIFSILVFSSTAMSFNWRYWFEMSWNFNLAGHVLVLCFALYRSIPKVHNWYFQLMKLMVIVCGLFLIFLIAAKWSNPLFYKALGFMLILAFIGSIFAQIFHKSISK